MKYAAKGILNVIIVCVFVIVIFHPDRHAKYYTFIENTGTFDEIFMNPVQNNKLVSTCPKSFYKQLIETKREVDLYNVYDIEPFTSPVLGGEYSPSDCYPIFSVAIIVPYRNRETQLTIFLKYMHYFLQKQKLRYRIFVVEQSNVLPFNRAQMLNVGALEAMKMNYSCLILHDVDLFPLNLQNIYACFKKPRHMSSSIDTFRYNLPYLGLCGGVLSIQASQFKKINGMSNIFYGWGGEDDDFFKRLQKYDLIPCRLSPEVSVYTMMSHKKEVASADRLMNLKYTIERQEADGLNTVGNNYKVHLKALYTLVVVF
ncbi:hypothetical protein RI129_011268 [Pyrocoelia pectoralis]|uniref:Beta-1,4-N-acetylgalactosaminyltransferase n=1 Tax=Pyrocoelia pectoralis TaxID=417401 RepID=A0AAN7ZEF4_9COLE